MFDIGWSELLIFAVVTLIVVGPKELPAILRTVGRYVGMVRQQANEFRRHFDAAMREAEVDRMQEELESIHKDIDRSIDDAKASVDEGKSAVETAVDDVDKKASKPAGALPEDVAGAEDGVDSEPKRLTGTLAGHRHDR